MHCNMLSIVVSYKIIFLMSLISVNILIFIIIYLYPIRFLLIQYFFYTGVVMPFCPNCGSENNAASNFCKDCGNELNVSKSAPSIVKIIEGQIKSQPQKYLDGTSEVLKNLNSRAPFFLGLFFFSFLTSIKGYDFNETVAASGLGAGTSILGVGLITLLFYGINYWCVEFQAVKKSKPIFALLWGILFLILNVYSVATDIQEISLYNFYDYLGLFCTVGILYGIFSIYKETKDKIS
jgi:hypothetical protein